MLIRPLATIVALAILPILACAPDQGHDHHHHHHHHGHDHHHHHGHMHDVPAAAVVQFMTSEDGSFQIDLLTDWTYRMGPGSKGAPSTGTWTSTADLIEFTGDANASVAAASGISVASRRRSDASIRDRRRSMRSTPSPMLETRAASTRYGTTDPGDSPERRPLVVSHPERARL